MNSFDKILELVEDWRAEITDSKEGAALRQVLDNLRFLERVKYHPYVPVLYSNHSVSYMDRLHTWMNNPGLSKTDQRILLEFADRISFFSFEDFMALFQAAFKGPITRWCLEQAKINLNSGNWASTIEDELFNQTWYCSVTDSLLISVFHHVNNIEGKERKPSFRDLAEFGDVEKVNDFIERNKFARVVLLEDFVGTGTQSLKAVKWALRNLAVPVLFCPIIICQQAIDVYHKLLDKFEAGNLSGAKSASFCFAHIYTLSPDCFVFGGSSELQTLMVEVQRIAETIHESQVQSSTEFKKGYLGWWDEGSTQKGATAVMFSNTPNNSLPLIHYESTGWKPLFPRVARQPL